MQQLTKVKNVRLAFLLAILFGPVGLLYASRTAGIVMLIVGIILCIFFPIAGTIIVWVISIISAVVIAQGKNGPEIDFGGRKYGE